MKKSTIITTALATLIAIPLLAQVPMPPVLHNTPFWHWPSLYATAENLVVKRGVNVDGTVNDKLYFRIGWGPCLAVHVYEWDELLNAVQEDRYINMRDYADNKWNEWPEEWGPDDSNNCPAEPETPTEIEDYVF